MLLRVADLAATHRVAGAIASLARPGDLIVLAGEMGAGKTAFAQGFGRALGITEPITSPTFTLVHSYPTPGRVTLHHADLYRLERTGDVADLALHELASFDGIVLVEWGDVAASGLGEHLELRLLHDDESDVEPASDGHEPVEIDAAAPPTARLIEISANGSSWAGRWDRLVRAVAEFRC